LRAPVPVPDPKTRFIFKLPLVHEDLEICYDVPVLEYGACSMAEKNIRLEYEISSRDGQKKNFLIELDPDSLALVFPLPDVYPEWTKLGCSQCENCPLDPNDHPHCPVAVSLIKITGEFSRNISHEEVSVSILTKPRNYQRNIPLHDALRSIFGIYMVTSGCPIMDKLRPLVLIHLPFATMAETTYRALSMYALAQFFIKRKGGEIDWEFKGLDKIYRDVGTVNRAFHKRLQNAGFSDANLNAIGNLDCYAQFTQMTLEPEKLKRLEKLFSAYL
jgi:hypothetical protein